MDSFVDGNCNAIDFHGDVLLRRRPFSKARSVTKRRGFLDSESDGRVRMTEWEGRHHELMLEGGPVNMWSCHKKER